jgi:hypothetical protein
MSCLMAEGTGGGGGRSSESWEPQMAKPPHAAV